MARIYLRSAVLVRGLPTTSMGSSRPHRYSSVMNLSRSSSLLHFPQALGRSLLGAMSDEARGAVTAGAGHASGGTLDALAAEHEIRIEARRDFEKELQERHRRSMRQ